MRWEEGRDRVMGLNKVLKREGDGGTYIVDSMTVGRDFERKATERKAKSTT